MERRPGKATLVPEHARLRGLWEVSSGLLSVMQRHRSLTEVTLGGDARRGCAVGRETHKATALHGYKGYKVFHP